MEKRIYDKKVNLDMDKVKSFWEDRANAYTEEHPYVSVKFSDKNPEEIDEWDMYEKKEIISKLNFDNNSVVIDIGCGVGRIADEIGNDVKYYLGSDFSESLISIAQKRFTENDNCDFISCAFQDLKVENYPMIEKYGKYNKVIIAGVLPYINDSNVAECFENLLKLIQDNTDIYIASTVAVNDRLTLKDLDNTDFNMDYNAIYRNYDEHIACFKPLFDAGFTLKEHDIFDVKKNKYSDTKLQYFILER